MMQWDVLEKLKSLTMHKDWLFRLGVEYFQVCFLHVHETFRARVRQTQGLRVCPAHSAILPGPNGMGNSDSLPLPREARGVAERGAPRWGCCRWMAASRTRPPRSALFRSVNRFSVPIRQLFLCSDPSPVARCGTRTAPRRQSILPR